MIQNKEVKSVYIHIPFCKSICSYCDFCKIYYDKKIVIPYLDSLKNEINKYYKNETLDTIYIGGGTPSSLSIKELTYLFDILKTFKTSKNLEFTFECNVEDINEDMLKILIKNKVNRLSIGIESIKKELLNFLNRNHNREDIKNKIELAKIYFDNINVDLIYAIPNETFEDLSVDLEFIKELNINHISTYSLIIEPNTILSVNKVKNINEDLDYEMYELIRKTLKDYNHYEVSNFSKEGYESKHNLTYWNNDEYYGFGVGASGYINGIRYTNTRSINKYINNNYHLIEEKITSEIKLENELILGLRKIDGINKTIFEEKYGYDIKNLKEISKLIKEGKLQESNTDIYIPYDMIYVSNDILIDLIGGHDE